MALAVHPTFHSDFGPIWFQLYITEITKVGLKNGGFAKFCAKKNDHELKIGFERRNRPKKKF